MHAAGACDRQPTSEKNVAGGQGGYRFFDKLAPAAGMLTDVRVLNVCVRPDGDRAVCTASRAGEKDREVGSVRVQGLVALSYTFASWGIVSASMQFPVTPKRDFQIAGSVGVQFLFGSRGGEKWRRSSGREVHDHPNCESTHEHSHNGGHEHPHEEPAPPVAENEANAGRRHGAAHARGRAAVAGRRARRIRGHGPPMNGRRFASSRAIAEPA